MSTAKKVVKQEHLNVLKDLDIQTFESLVATISSNEYFQAYDVEYPTDGVLSLSSGPIHMVIVEKSVWNDKQAFRPFFDRRKDSHLCICLSFLDNDADVLDLELDSDLHGIGLPVSGIQLAVTIDNHFRLQQAIHASTTDKEKVAETSEHVKYVLRISRELNGIRDTNKLLSLILLKAREVTNADAGSIYVVERQDGSDDGEIVFKVTQNETVTQALDEFRIPISEGSIVGNAVVKERSINIPDLYHLDPDPDKNPFKVKHDRTWDEKIGYQCRSMLTLPMFDISHQVIGVIQLINRKKDNIPNLKNLKDFSEFVLPFEPASVEYAEIVAQQAGIALENALLTQEKEELFEGFVHASVTAIEQRDPTTSGHSNRVAQLTLGMAQLLNDIDHGKFASIRFDKNQLKEIEYASLLHDFGKLGVREQVLTKAKKLYPWELELVLERFDHIRSRHQIEYLEDTIKYLQDQRAFPPGFGPENLKRSYERKLNELQEFLEFILKSNEPTVLEQGGFEKLKDIANFSFTDCHKKQKPFLKARELEALSVSRGSLTREEFAEIQSHVNHTYEFLRKIPWGRAFSNVPQIAAKHHEKLDGSGYPTSARGGEIPVQTRIMTISDIYDALTASDRPYKKAVPVDRALDILNMEVKAGKLDSDLFQLFLESKVYNSTM